MNDFNTVSTLTKELDVEERTQIKAVIQSRVTSPSLSYSCLLIPRFFDHYLVGDIEQDLIKWAQNICIAYGWRLEAIKVYPECIHWIMSVGSESSIRQCMKIFSHESSKKILEHYPRFQMFGSKTFWASENSVKHGNMPHSLDEIDLFILKVREDQGYNIKSLEKRYKR